MSLYSSIPHKENVTYQLIPGNAGDQHWQVRLLEGPFNETVIQYGTISLANDKGTDVEDGDEDAYLNFDFFVESSPDENLTSEDVDLQMWAGDVLQQILKDAVENYSAVITESDE